MTDVLTIDRVLDATTLEQIRREMRVADGDPATVLGSRPGHRVTSTARKATRIRVSKATYEVVAALLQTIQPCIEAHFGRHLDGHEEPQFLRYGSGDYFVAHQDGNTPLVRDESRYRKISVVILLSAQSQSATQGTYAGGALVLHAPLGQAEPQLTIAPAPGTLLAFPSETTHEVLPITYGERLSVVSWYRG